MNEFLVGLQFLTRIRFVTQTEWTAESFGKSVKYFPAIGAILGLILSGFSYLFYAALPHYGFALPAHITAALLLIFSILLTGGLTADGFMDTMDGVFSGRSRERMLEIMKDSRVGANGVMAFTLLVLCKWSLLLDLSNGNIAIALFAMPVISRMAMVIGITLFPYARPEGIGKAFAQYASKKTLWFAAMFTVVLLVPCGLIGAAAMLAVILFTAWFGRYITKALGGLTGDVYGALTELSELFVLLIFLMKQQI